MNIYWLLISFILNKSDFCSCIPNGSIDDKQYDQYSLIAKGKVEKITVKGYERIIYLKIDSYYKGGAGKEKIKITTPSQQGICGISPKVGEQWLVFAYAEGTGYHTHLCTRTKNMNPEAWNYNKNEIDNDIKFLEMKKAQPSQ